MNRDDLFIAEQPVELVDAKNGRLLDRKSQVQFIHMQPSVRLFCYIDDPPRILSRILPDESYSYLKDVTALGTVLTTPPMRVLPDQWYGYNGASVLLVGNVDPIGKGRRVSQVQAMLDWAGQGGVLVLFATEEMQRMLDGPLGRAAKVSCAGLMRLRELDVRSSDGKFSADVTLPSPTLFADLACDGAEVLCTANDVPLLTRRGMDKGTFSCWPRPWERWVKNFPPRRPKRTARAMPAPPPRSRPESLNPRCIRCGISSATRWCSARRSVRMLFTIRCVWRRPRPAKIANSSPTSWPRSAVGAAQIAT